MDLSLFSFGTGSDSEFNVSSNVFNIIYLQLFGGNVEADTPVTPEPGQERFDWWGNSLLDRDVQFNSFTERALSSNSLGEQGLRNISIAIQRDLRGLNIGDINVNLTMPRPNNISIGIQINEPTNEQDQMIIFVWDQTRNEVIETRML